MTMIVDFAELQLMVFGDNTMSEAERAVLNYVHAQSEAKVKKYICYDPVQREATEYYPRLNYTHGQDVQRFWDVNVEHTKAILETIAVGQDTLQLERLPVRSISSLRVDHDGHWDTTDDAFESGDVWTEGTDFYSKWYEQYYNPTGMIEAAGSWPATRGAIKVTYTGGYSRLELANQAHASSTSDQDGLITVAGVDGSGIRDAVVMTVQKAMVRWEHLRDKQRTGLLGALQSERMQDYSYQLGGGPGMLGSILNVALPPEAEEAADPYVNWGMMRL